MQGFKSIAQLALATGTLFAIPSTARALDITDISGRDAGHIQFPKSEAAAAFRPRTAADDNLIINNYYIHDLTNQKGLDIRASTQGSAAAWAYQNITIENSTFKNIVRREDLPGGNGLHIDHIRIAGGGNNQDTKINVTIENVTIDGGDALPILITDGMYGTVTLRNVIIKNTTLNNVQFKTDKVGSVDKIIVDNSPGLGVALIGRPGSIGEVLVRNSPGIRLGDSINATGRTGAAISFIDAASGQFDGIDTIEESLSGLHLTPAVPNAAQLPGTVTLPVAAAVPEPGAMFITAVGVAMLATRRR